jgi:copper homeostasis protein
MTLTLLEVCVDAVEGLAAAIAGGADRIELCSALSLGGLTPSHGFIQVAAMAPVPVRAMIRPRGGSFVFTLGETDVMRRDIDVVRAAGLAGVVIGAATKTGALDLATLQTLVAHAEGLDVSLHRVVDLLPNGEEAVDVAVALGLSTILTSGAALTAEAGCDRIAAMRVRAAGRIEILAGGGISADNVGRIVATSGVRSVHASCSRIAATADPRAVAFGFASPYARETDTDLVANLRAALTRAR